jgi:hypothetical protein
MRNLYIIIISLICGLEVTGQVSCNITASATSYDILCGDAITLSAIGEGVVLFDSNFNGGTAGAGWESTGSAVFTNPCGPSYDGNTYFWMGPSSDVRALITAPMDLSTGGEIRFYMKYATQGGADPCEGPDLYEEGVYFQYSVAGGPWQLINYYDPRNGNDPTRTTWTQYPEAIPTGAMFNNVRLRWVQDQFSSDAVPLPRYYDHWGLDDVEVKINPPGALYKWPHDGLGWKSSANTPSVTPTSNTTYTVEFSPDGGTTVCSDDVQIVVNNLQLSVTGNPTDICPGDPVQLDATDFVGEIPTSCALNNDLTCDPEKDEAGEIKLGIGTTIQTGGNNTSNPFGSSNCGGAMRAQLLYRANEIQAKGFNGGKIKYIAFQIAQINQGGTYKNFRMRINCTGINQLNKWPDDLEVNVPNTVINSTEITLKLGWNELNFDKAYDWDGVSNIIIDLCWNIGEQSTNENEVFPYLTDVGFRASASSCTNGAGGNDNNCGATDIGNSSHQTKRANTKFGFCQPNTTKIPSYSWTPAGTINDPSKKDPIANPLSSTTYTCTVNIDGNPAGCAVSKSISINVQDAPETPVPTYNTGLCERDNLVINFGSTLLP